MTTFPTATSVFASAGTSAVAGTFPENKTSSYLAHPSPTQNFPPESSSTLRSQPPDDFGGGFNKAAQIGTAIGVVIGGLGLIAIIVFGFKTRSSRAAVNQDDMNEKGGLSSSRPFFNPTESEVGNLSSVHCVESPSYHPDLQCPYDPPSLLQRSSRYLPKLKITLHHNYLGLPESLRAQNSLSPTPPRSYANSPQTMDKFSFPSHDHRFDMSESLDPHPYSMKSIFSPAPLRLPLKLSSDSSSIAMSTRIVEPENLDRLQSMTASINSAEDDDWRQASCGYGTPDQSTLSDNFSDGGMGLYLYPERVSSPEEYWDLISTGHEENAVEEAEVEGLTRRPSSFVIPESEMARHEP